MEPAGPYTSRDSNPDSGLHPIQGAKACPFCGYSLQGLALDTPCPECGQRAEADALAAEGAGLLEKVRGGMLALLVSRTLHLANSVFMILALGELLPQTRFVRHYSRAEADVESWITTALILAFAVAAWILTWPTPSESRGSGVNFRYIVRVLSIALGILWFWDSVFILPKAAGVVLDHLPTLVLVLTCLYLRDLMAQARVAGLSVACGVIAFVITLDHLIAISHPGNVHTRMGISRATLVVSDTLLLCVLWPMLQRIRRSIAWARRLQVEPSVRASL